MCAKVAVAVIVLAASLAPATAMAQASDNQPVVTDQIDRFEAIHLLQESLKSSPNDAASWIVLGELAHEVAQHLSSKEDQQYYKLSQEAYEKALALQPKSTRLKAAVEIAREQTSGATRWDQARREAARNYIAARKLELAGSGFNPTVRAVSLSPATAPPAQVAPAYSAPVNQPAQTYQYTVYQPFNVPSFQPYNYQAAPGTYGYTTAPYYTYATAPVMISQGAHRRRSER
jgi:hypothetical protein